MDQLRALDMIAVLFVTWRPFNMLFDCQVEDMAPDEPGRRVMLAWLDRLRGIQSDMENRGHDPSLAYPANFNSASPTSRRTPRSSVSTEIRLAFALNGGVSLAIWIGGVADEVLRCINGGRDAAEGHSETPISMQTSAPSWTSHRRRTC